MKRMTNSFKRWFSLLMSVVMITTQLQLPVYAEGTADDPDAEEVVVSEEKENDPEEPEEDPYLNVVSYEADPGVNIVWINTTFDEPLTPIGETAASAKAEDYYPGMGIILVASANQIVDNDVDEHVVTTIKDDYEYRSRTEHLAYGYNAAYMFPGYGELLFESETTYHYRLALQLSTESLVYLTPDDTFTTAADKDITGDFTDPYILLEVKEALGLGEEDPVMLSQVENKTNFSAASGDENFEFYAESLAGIENYKSLLSIDISYHNIKDISEVKSLRYLSILSMPGNDIRVLPDLRGLTYLGYRDTKQMQGKIDLDYNVIVRASVAVDKLPAGYVDCTDNPVERGGGGFQRDWPVVEPRLARDNTYYQIGDKHPLLVEFDGLKTQHESTYPYTNVRGYTVRAFIGENEYVLSRHNSTNLFICEDIPGVTLNTPVSVRFLIADNTATILWEGSRTVTFKGDVDTIAHITVNGTDFFDVIEGNKPAIVFANGDYWGMVVTGSWLGEEISAVMVGEDGVSHAVAFEDDGTSSAASAYENRYCDMNNDGGGTWTINTLEGTVQRTVLGTVSVVLENTDKSWFVPGDYSIKITKNGTDYTTIATVTVTNGSVAGAIDVSDKYDSSGEYVYVETLVSVNCYIDDPRASYPTLYLNEQAVTTFDPAVADSAFYSHYGLVYKLKKTGGDLVWEKPQKFTYAFTNAAVNAVSRSDTTIYYEPSEQGLGDYAYTLTIDGNAERSIKPKATDALTAKHTEPVGEMIHFSPVVWTSTNKKVVTVSYEGFGADKATVTAVGEGTAWVIAAYGGRTAYVKYTVSATTNTDPDPNPNPNPEKPEEKPEDPTPTPAPDAPLHSISVVEGATAKNSAGKEVTTAKENETISISWTAKADYDFVKWDISGATPKDSVSANTIFVMGKEDVIVSYDEKLKVDSQVLESLPTDADRSAKVTALKFDSKKLTMQKGSKKEYKVNVKAADGATPKTYYVTKNKEIVAVDENGNFYATGIGETEVTAYCGSRSATVKVTVVCYTESISILDSSANDVTEGTIELKGNEKEFLTVSFNPYDSTDSRAISWKSDNTKAVKISKGIITAKEVKQEETAKITATYKVTTADGKTEKKTATVTVKVKPVEVSNDTSGDTAHKLTLSKKSLTVKYSEKDKKAVELTANIQAKNGDFAAVKIEAESTNNDVVSVNKISDITGSGKKGKATITLDPKSAGIAYIIVKTTAADGKTNVKRCKVTINTPVTDIVIKSGTLKVDSSLKMELRKGTSGTIEAVIEPVGSTDMGKLKITGSGGVSVKNGVITAKKETKAGKPATIKVKCGKISKKIEVTIK